MASPLKKEAIVAASAYPPASPFSNFKISAPQSYIAKMAKRPFPTVGSSAASSAVPTSSAVMATGQAFLPLSHPFGYNQAQKRKA